MVFPGVMMATNHGGQRAQKGMVKTFHNDHHFEDDRELSESSRSLATDTPQQVPVLKTGSSGPSGAVRVERIAEKNH